MKKAILLITIVIALFRSGICQDTLYVTLNSRNCIPCYGLLQSFFEENDVTCTVVGLSLADTSDIEGYKDKMITNHLLSFCDTILYVDSYRQKYFLIPLKTNRFKIYNNYLKLASPSLLLINEKRKIKFVSAQGLKSKDAIRRFLADYID